MNTLDDFCRKLMDKYPLEERPGPFSVAKAFVRFFGLSVRPAMDELSALLDAAGIGTVSGAPRLGGFRGFHSSAPEGGYDILYREDQWEGAQEHTVLHETYEIIRETLGDLRSGAPPAGSLCREADRFAAAVLMQPGPFAAYAEATGLDVVALQKRYRRAYASVTLRLAEVMRGQPLLAVLYERRERGGPSAWAETPAPGAFRTSVVARTPGFSARSSRSLYGLRGGLLRRGMVPPPGSAAERVVLSGRPVYAEKEDDPGGRGGAAVAARPVFWQGRLAKVAVVAVPHSDRSVLRPQLVNASFDRLTEDKPTVKRGAPAGTVEASSKSRSVVETT